MLIVDSQIHIWENAKMSGHHRQIPTYSKDDALKVAHFARDTLHGACAKPKLAGDFKNALASTQLALDTRFHVGADFRRYWLEPL